MKRTLVLGLSIALAAWSAEAFAEGPPNPGAPPPPKPGSGESAPSPPRPPSRDGRAWDARIGEPDVISGRVVRRSGGDLIKGLEIDYPEDLPSGERRRRKIEVQPDGSFAIGGFKVGRSHDLVIRAFSYVSIGRVEDVAAGTRDLVIPVDPGGTIRGMVLDATGKHVGAGIDVFADLSREPDLMYCGTVCSGESSSTKTAEDGTFVLEWLGDWNFTVSARRGSKPDVEADRASWIPPGSTGLVLHLGPGPFDSEWSGDRREPAPHDPAASAISGRLLHPTGEPLSHGLHVQVVPEGGGETRGARVSPSGQFDTGSLAPGVYTVQARTDTLLVSERKGVRSGTGELEIPLALHGSIAGQVYDSTGKPVGKGVMVTAVADQKGPGSQSWTTTREDGTFLVPFLGEGPFTVWTRPARTSARRRLTDVMGWDRTGILPGVKGLALHLEAPVAVSGRVEWSASAPRPRSIWVYVKQPGRGGPHFPGNSQNPNEDGGFTVEGLAAGRVRIDVKVDGKEYDLGEFEAPAKDLVLKIPDHDAPR